MRAAATIAMFFLAVVGSTVALNPQVVVSKAATADTPVPHHRRLWGRSSCDKWWYWFGFGDCSSEDQNARPSSRAQVLCTSWCPAGYSRRDVTIGPTCRWWHGLGKCVDTNAYQGEGCGYAGKRCMGSLSCEKGTDAETQAAASQRVCKAASRRELSERFLSDVVAPNLRRTKERKLTAGVSNISWADKRCCCRAGCPSNSGSCVFFCHLFGGTCSYHAHDFPDGADPTIRNSCKGATWHWWRGLTCPSTCPAGSG